MLIDVRDVKKSFDGELVLDGVSFQIAEGEKVILFGHNGSGKTTLLRCIMGLESFQGTIKVKGNDVMSPQFHRFKAKIGYVPQQMPVWFVDVDDMINLIAEVKKIPRKEIESVCAELELDVGAVRRKKLTELSGGMRQKLFLSFALAGKPELLVLDEPFSNLDIRSQQKLFEILESSKTTQLISTHRLEDVSFATRVIWMKMGKVEFDGEPKALLETVGKTKTATKTT